MTNHEEIFSRSRQPEYRGIYSELATILNVTRQCVHNKVRGEVALKPESSPTLAALEKLMNEWDKAAARAAKMKEQRTSMLRRKAS